MGLVLGGVLVEAASWRWIFFVNVPVGLVLVFATARYVPESRARTSGQTFDLPGATAVTAGLLVVVFGIVQSSTYGWASARTMGLLGLGVILLAAFLLIEARVPPR